VLCDQSAIETDDYGVLASDTVTFPSGSDLEMMLSVPIKIDSIVEDTEQFLVKIEFADINSIAPGENICGPDKATITIEDDDSPGRRVAKNRMPIVKV